MDLAPIPTVTLTPPLEALAAVARAALGGVHQAEFLPLAVREAAALLGAQAAEVWLAEEGLALAASYRSPGISTRSPDAAWLREVLASQQPGGEVTAVGGPHGWLASALPGRGSAARGVLAVQRPGLWTGEEETLVDAAATMIALGLTVADMGHFDREARNEFLALVGHDLRSPLANVRVGAQLARRNLEAGDVDSVRRALVIIENQSGRLVDRLEKLLEAVAADGRLLVRLESLDLAAIVAATIAPLRLATEEGDKGTRFEVFVQPGTPHARGDLVQVGQVMEQLLDNAAKYAPGGLITTKIYREGSMVRVDVSDTGPGIRPEDVERVFAPFGRGKNAGSQTGYGLGLYLARNLIGAHGGRLWISRTSRSGTCMSFTLPVAEGEEG